MRLSVITAHCLRTLFALWVGCLSVLSAQAQTVPQVAGNFRESNAAAAKFRIAPIPGWVTPVAIPPVKDSAEPFVVRLGDTQFNWSNPQREVFIRRVFEAKNASSTREIGQILIEFNPEYQSVQLHMVRILRNNEVIEQSDRIRFRFLERELGLENSMYNGTVTALGIAEDVRPGDSVEYAYTVTGFNPVLGSTIADAASWQAAVPVHLRYVSALIPADRKVQYRFVGNNAGTLGITPKRLKTGELQKLVFEGRDIPSYRPEDGYPRDFQPVPWIQFSEYENWNQVAKWATGLFNQPAPEGKAFAALVERLKKLPSPEQQIIEALNFTQTEIRYTSVSLGESSHRPAPPEETLNKRYGDCKDKSVFLVTLLHALGIQAEPVLVGVRNWRGFGNWLPSPALFDHVIVRAELNGQSYWLDPTAYQQAGNLASLGILHGLSEVLVVAPSTKQLSIIPIDPKDRAESISVYQNVILENMDGPATLEETWVMQRTWAEGFRRFIQIASLDKVKKAFHEDMQAAFPSAEWAKEPEIRDNREKNELTMKLTFKVAKFVEKESGGWRVRHKLPPTLRFYMLAPSSVQQRSGPFALRFPEHSYFRHTVVLPQNVSMVQNDQSLSVRNAYLAVKQIRRGKGNSLQTEYEFEVLQPEVPGNDIGRFTEDIRKIGEFRGSTYIDKSMVKSSSMFGRAAPEEEFAKTVRERLQNNLSEFNQVIENKKLASKDLAFALSERANIHAQLGNASAARQDAEQALRLDSRNSAIQRSVADTFFSLSEYDKSLEHYTRALLASSDKSGIYYRRGIIYTLRGEFDAARDELQQALENDADEENARYHLIWYLIASARQGVALPKPIQARVRATTGDAWPQPAIRALGGLQKPESVLSALEKMRGDEKLLAQCEGHFYLGEYYLAKGDMMQARQYLEKARNSQIVIYIEQDAARKELEHLFSAGNPAQH